MGNSQRHSRSLSTKKFVSAFQRQYVRQIVSTQWMVSALGSVKPVPRSRRQTRCLGALSGGSSRHFNIKTRVDPGRGAACDVQQFLESVLLHNAGCRTRAITTGTDDGYV